MAIGTAKVTESRIGRHGYWHVVNGEHLLVVVKLANLFPLPAIKGGLFVGCLTSGNQAQRSDWINSCIEASLSAVSRAGAFGCEVNGLLRSGAVGQDDGCQPHQAAIASRTLVSAACERMAGVLVFSEGRCDRDADIEAPACAAQK